MSGFQYPDYELELLKLLRAVTEQEKVHHLVGCDYHALLAERFWRKPVFEDGAPVQIGDAYTRGSCKDVVSEMRFKDGKQALNYDWYDCGECVRRPKPPRTREGVLIEEGMRLFGADDRCWTITAIGPCGIHMRYDCMGECGGSVKPLKAGWLSTSRHEKLTADGKAVWCDMDFYDGSGKVWTVESFDKKGKAVCRDAAGRKKVFDASELYMEHPVPETEFARAVADEIAMHPREYCRNRFADDYGIGEMDDAECSALMLRDMLSRQAEYLAGGDAR